MAANHIGRLQRQLSFILYFQSSFKILLSLRCAAAEAAAHHDGGLRLNKLKVFFYVYNSNLIGEIPERIGDMVYLEKLVMSQNGLCGGISSGLFMLKNISILVGKIQEDFRKHQSEHG